MAAEVAAEVAGALPRLVEMDLLLTAPVDANGSKASRVRQDFGGRRDPMDHSEYGMLWNKPQFAWDEAQPEW